MVVRGQGEWIAKLQLQTGIYCLYTTVALVNTNKVKYMYMMGVHEVSKGVTPSCWKLGVTE